MYIEVVKIIIVVVCLDLIYIILYGMRTSIVGSNFTPREKGVPLNSILNIGSLSKWDQFPSLRAFRAFFLLFLFGNIDFLALVSISVLRRRIPDISSILNPELVKFSITFQYGHGLYYIAK